MLEINNLHVSINDKEILHGVDLRIPEGEVHALFGPNGSGKSVMIMTIMGYPEYEITEGSIRFRGMDIVEMGIDERAELGLALSEQRPPTIQGVKLRNLLDLLMPEDEEGRFFVQRMIDKFRIERFLDRNINEGLSGGEIKQSELFLVLITHPSFLMLDEPDSGVDPEHMKKIGAMVDQSLRGDSRPGEDSDEPRRKAGLIATHSASILDYIRTEKAHVMLDGKIRCSGEPREMMAEIRQHGYNHCIRRRTGMEQAV